MVDEVTPEVKRVVRCNDATCDCGGCQEDKCEGKSCMHFGVIPLLDVWNITKWDSSKFTRKEQNDLKKNPIRISGNSNVSCPCGRFKNKPVKFLKKNGREYYCPECGNYIFLRGMFYVRLARRESGFV
jgi:hypothetical protein